MIKPQNTLLQNKAEFTKFQILYEIRRNQPHVKQKQIGDKLGITTQAISKYFKKLAKEGYIESSSERADYRLTPKGAAKLHENLARTESFFKKIKNELKVEHAWVAIATQPVKAGEQVNLVNNGGIFYAAPISNLDTEVVGTAISNANPGEDVGLKNLKGKFKPKQGRILIVKLPSTHKGGLRATNLTKIRNYYNGFKPDRVAVMGAVGKSVAVKLGLKVDLEFGISYSVAIAASRGLNVFVLVVGRMVKRMIQEIDKKNLYCNSEIVYEIKDAQIINYNTINH